MSRYSNYPEHVDREERPERTAENIPDKKLERAARFFSWEECTECGHRQWWLYVPGHNSTGSCDECGTSHKLVG